MNYEKSEFSYDIIKDEVLYTLDRNLNKYKLPINQSIAYYMNESEGTFEENELERVLTYVVLGIFIKQYSYNDEQLINKVISSIKTLESNEYNNLLHDGDKELIDNDIKVIKEYLK
ncbi:hypothetical protein FDB08_04005 [Clostridium botulinum]|nr:hypothetical protein [Clostridium botulinum]NFL02410.1 hypothetical protein [Clostridium botulinum]